MSDRPLILFAYYFPPDPAIGGARPYRFYKYLRRLGYNVRVFTASPQAVDRPLENVEYVPDPFASEHHGAVWQIERVVRKTLLPGALGLSWAHAAARQAERFLRNEVPDKAQRAAVFSTCPPVGAHYAAWLFTRRAGLPWVADFRDPLTGQGNQISGFNALHLKLLAWIERRVMETAPVVVANTDSMADEWRNRYAAQAAKIQLIWNGFDPEESLAALEIEPRPFKVLSHVGELYAGRTVTPVLESIGRLIDRETFSADSIRVKIIGPAKAAAIPSPDFVARGRAQGWLELSPEPVSQSTARQISQSSDGLLLIQPQSAVQVPGKLYEYLQIGRPILAFVPPHSPVERILSRAGIPYKCVYPSMATEEMDNAIHSFFELRNEVSATSAWFQETFQARSQAKTLSELIEKVAR